MGGQQAKLKYIEDLRKSLIASDKKEIEILESLRLGSKDYDFKTVNKINEGG
jgi:hypothetical protein